MGEKTVAIVLNLSEIVFSYDSPRVNFEIFVFCAIGISQKIKI